MSKETDAEQILLGGETEQANLERTTQEAVDAVIAANRLTAENARYAHEPSYFRLKAAIYHRMNGRTRPDVVDRLLHKALFPSGTSDVLDG